MFPSLLKKMKQDRDFRIKQFLILSFVFNFAYALFLFIVSRIYFSKWFLVMSIYFGLLSIIRIIIFSQIHPQKSLRKKILLMRTCGYFLFVLNVVVSAMIFVLIYTAQPVIHHEITVIAIAAYTFYSLTLGIIGSTKHLKQQHHVYSCIKLVNLLSASISMVTLTNTMLATWGNENILLRNIILPTLSGCVSIFIIVCAILMIIKANSDLRMLKNEEK